MSDGVKAKLSTVTVRQGGKRRQIHNLAKLMMIGSGLALAILLDSTPYSFSRADGQRGCWAKGDSPLTVDLGGERRDSRDGRPRLPLGGGG